MSFMKKNVNNGLLLLIILLAVAIAGLGIYYNYDYGSLSAKYNDQVQNLQKTTDDLMMHKSRLNQTTSELKLKEQDESELGQKYTDIRNDNERLDIENRGLQSDLTIKINQLNAKIKELADAKVTLITQTAEIDELSDDLDICENIKDDLEDKIDDVCDECPTYKKNY